MSEFFLHSFNTLSHGLVGYLIPFLFVLTIVVFFHELGHFLVARWAGVKVLTFSLGFGPELAGFNDRHGTRWKISAIPLGGYVKFFGDESEASTPSSETLANMTAEERDGSFHHKKVGPRAAIVAAGPIANFILAVVIFAGMSLYYGKPNSIPRVDAFQPDSVAAAGRIQGGRCGHFDRWPHRRKFCGHAADRFDERRFGARIPHQARQRPRHPDRDTSTAGKKGPFSETPTRSACWEFSIMPARRDARFTPVGYLESLKIGVEQVWFIITGTFKFVGSLFAGAGSAGDLGGPLRIAQMSGQAASLGFQFLVQLCAALSVSIGLLNLFPVPLLDGGHLLFYAFEAVRGRPLSDRAQEMGFRIGLGLVLMLMVFRYL